MSKTRTTGYYRISSTGLVPRVCLTVLTLRTYIHIYSLYVHVCSVRTYVLHVSAGVFFMVAHYSWLSRGVCVKALISEISIFQGV